MKTFISICLILILSSCAQQVAPNGGIKDETPPKVQGAKPENKSIRFNADKITIRFDEYIQIKDPSQIVISPFLRDKPQIDAVGKTIEITFLQSKPEPKTTYTINFGNSIVDVNEGNVLENFTYVFATGDILDSNKIEGIVIHAFKRTPIKNGLVGLYKKSSFNDSTLQKKYPSYFSKSKEDGSFIIENLPEDSFFLLAFEDANSDNKYQKNENVAFEFSPLFTGDNKTNISLKIFEPYQFKDDHLLDTISKYRGKFQFPIYKLTSTQILYLGKEKYQTQVIKGQNEIDTINIFIPSIPDTSKPLFTLSNKDTTYNLSFRTKGKIRTLEFNIQIITPSKPTDSIKVISNLPIENFPLDSITIKVDTIIVKPIFTKVLSPFEWVIYTPLKENSAYTIALKDSIVTNAYGRSNKSVQTNFIAPDSKNFGNLLLSIQNKKKEGIILQLVEDTKDEKLIETFIYPETSVQTIKYLKANTYKLKVILDDNNNGKWDNGNLQKRIQPEQVYYHNQSITIKAYWDIEQSIDIDNIISN
jgi:hypothetical protein